MSRDWEGRTERHLDDLYDRPVRTGLKWLAIIVAVIIVISLIGGVIGLAGGWFSGAKETVSFDNSKAQVTAVIKDEKEMIATAGNVCEVKDAKTNAAGNDPLIVEDPAFAYKATYRSIKADYDRRQANLYEGGIVTKFGASNLPKVAPTLNERIAGDFCDQ